MDLTTFGLITFLVGGMMFILGLPMIFATNWFNKEMMATLKEKAGLGTLQMLGLAMAVFGFWILSVEYVLASGLGWDIVIPILGYVFVIKGALVLWAPKLVEQMGEQYYGKNSNMILIGIVSIAFGALMWWLTFSVF